MTVTVRKATKQDAEAVAELAVALAGLHVEWNPKRFTAFAMGERATEFYDGRTEATSAAVFVAEDEGRVIGFAYMEYEPVIYAELATRAAWLHDIFVEPDARGMGAGRALLDAVRDEAKKFGANKVLLGVAVNNEAGHLLFERNGFETTMHEMMLVIE